MTILTVGIDLAKNVFAVHGVNEAGRPELVRPAVPRDKLAELVCALPPCSWASPRWECEGTSHLRATASMRQDWRCESSICSH